MSESQTQPAGWYHAQGDPPGTQRYWDGTHWQGQAEPLPGGEDPIAGLQLAEPVNRIGARVIDGIVWIVLLAVVAYLVTGTSGIGLRADGVSYTAHLIATVIGTALVTAYEVLMVLTRQATLGKVALGLKVTRQDGSPPGRNDALLRAAPFALPLILAALAGGLGWLFVVLSVLIGVGSVVLLFIDPRRQTVWDKLARTVVVGMP
ncbi:MAG: RDD family protein [Acidimicrobiia bacterium]|nr:RDD family protein [Acidimicrobiia bacterium]MDH4364141.1 RDD family protein [Acidimicrobiia bacterium]MDH5288639.1 RDD family protein [Acidimicrobiia bacterium]